MELHPKGHHPSAQFRFLLHLTGEVQNMPSLATKISQRAGEEMATADLVDKATDKATERANAEKNKALSVALQQIERSYGKGAIMRMGAGERASIEAIQTGAINLDAAIGVGGVPRGRVTEIYGPE